MTDVITLGCCDATVSEAQRKDYLAELKSTTRLDHAKIEDGLDKVTLKAYEPVPEAMSVVDVQRALKTIGFFPGGKDDGICGYRTLSAMRLFQEYLYSVEKKKDCPPDGQLTLRVQGSLREWRDARRTPRWAPTVDQWKAGTLAPGEYTQWLAFLERVKQHSLAQPNRMLEKVNAFKSPTDTKKVAEWDFSARQIHLIGIRRHHFDQRSDDIFVLLIKGLVFKFQGSTEPGAAGKDEKTGLLQDPPFLVQGQHDYHFGWHGATYLALKPLSWPSSGVLVVRSKDLTLDAADLDNELQVNSTINIHWGGRGVNLVRGWSHGCQVISGHGYINDRNELCSCAGYVADLPDTPRKDVSKTRGAYNVLLDLVTALGSDLGPTVKYMLLDESDLELDPQLGANLDDARQRARKLAGADSWGAPRTASPSP